MSNPVLFEELSIDVATELARSRGIVIVPAATTEAHGSHLPLGTDSFTAEWIARALSARTGLPALVPTPIRAGASPTFHYDSDGDPIPGTLAVGHATLHALIKDLVRGLWATGFRKVIFVQGHGQVANFQVIAHEAVTELRREGKAVFIAAATYWELAAQTLREVLTTPFYHAGEEETSNVLLARPDLVHLELAQGKPLKPLLDRSLLKRAITQDETETFSVWDVAQWIAVPEKGKKSRFGLGETAAIKSATAEKGRAILEKATERYLALIRDLEMHYAPQEVPGVDVRERPAQPRFSVAY